MNRVGIEAGHYAPLTRGMSMQAGDIGLCRATETRGKLGATTPIGKAIQAAERAAFGKDSPFAHWTHAFTVINSMGDITEAVEWETKRSHVARYYDTDCTIINTGFSITARSLIAQGALAHVGEPYGVVTFASDAATALGFPFDFGKPGEEVCSQETARNTEKGIDTYPWSLDVMLPGHLAAYWEVGQQTKWEPMGFWQKWENAALYFRDVIFG